MFAFLHLFSPLTCLWTVILPTDLSVCRLLSGCFTIFSHNVPPHLSFRDFDSFFPSTPHPVLIEDADAVLVAGVLQGNDSATLPPACPTVSPTPLPMASPSPPPTVDLGRISGWLRSLTCLVECLLQSAPVEDSVAPATPVLQVNKLDCSCSACSFEDPPSPYLLST